MSCLLAPKSYVLSCLVNIFILAIKFVLSNTTVGCNPLENKMYTIEFVLSNTTAGYNPLENKMYIVSIAFRQTLEFVSQGYFNQLQNFFKSVSAALEP